MSEKKLVFACFFFFFWLFFLTNLVQTWFAVRYFWTLQFDTNLDLNLDSRSHGLYQFPHKVFSWFKWNVAYCLDLLFLWSTLCSFYLIQSVFKGEKPTEVIFWFGEKKNLTVLAFKDLHTDLSYTKCDNRHHWTLHFDTSLNDLHLHLRSQLY